MWVLLRPIQSFLQGKYSILFPTNAILKLDDRTEVVRFEITSMISDQNCTTQSSIATILQPFWHRKIQSVPIFY